MHVNGSALGEIEVNIVLVNGVYLDLPLLIVNFKCTYWVVPNGGKLFLTEFSPFAVDYGWAHEWNKLKTGTHVYGGNIGFEEMTENNLANRFKMVTV